MSPNDALAGAAGLATASFRRQGVHLLAATLLLLALDRASAVGSPESLLPEDTLLVLTTPDYAKLRQAVRNSPRGRLWADPSMKPLKEKFLAHWRDEFVKPLARELTLNLDSWSSMPQGQITFAITRSAGRDDQAGPLGFLVLLDTRDKSSSLRTNLAELRRRWVAAGKPVKIERIRNIEVSIYPVTTNEMPKTLGKLLWRQPVFAPVSGGSELKQGPVDASRQGNTLLDALSTLLTASKELVVGQVDTLLVAGNSVAGVERVVNRLTGGAAPTLESLAAYQESHQANFRDAALYGWANVKAFVEALKAKPSESDVSDAPDPFDLFKPEKVMAATGVANCRTVAFTLRDTDEGSLFQLFLAVPESARQGIFAVATGPAREANPPPFVPGDVVEFIRWRIDCPGAWAVLEKILGTLSPQAMSAVNLILDTANARARQDDPGFDLKRTLLANLGDDFIRYEKPSRGHSLEELQSPPSLFLLGSPNPNRLAVALKRLFVIFPQGDTPAEREFLGRKIYSVPLPAFPFLSGGDPRSTPARVLNFAASKGYVALSTDVPSLEEYLRSSESQMQRLDNQPGLLEAAQRVGGMSTGLFAYENERENLRTAFAAARLNPGAATNGIGPCLFPGLPGITGAEAYLNDWMDFSLLPTFDRVAQYFGLTVWAGGVNVDGLSLNVFAPTPASLRSNSVVRVNR